MNLKNTGVLTGIIAVILSLLMVTPGVAQNNSSEGANNSSENMETIKNPELSDEEFGELQEIGASIEDEMEWLQAETYVITASKIWENIKKSAASVTVITAKDIRRMGARNVKEVLRSVPGISFQNDRHGSHDIEVRGILKDGYQHILYLWNSHSLNTNYWGGVGPSYTPFTVDHIQRIEVVRGPGSALYGANAFAAVVNIITKAPEEVDGVELTARSGSYSTQQYNILFGKKMGDVGITVNFDYFESDMYRGYIEQDVQTLLDQVTGGQASLAPGNTRGYDQKYDFSLTIDYKGLRVEGMYVDRDCIPSIGISPVLNDHSRTPSTDYALSASYTYDVTPQLNLLGELYHNYTFMDYYYQVYPENTVLPTPNGFMVWPDGLIGAPSNKNTRTGGELQATYTISESNILLGGLTYEYMNQYDVKALSNYLATPVRGVVIPRGGVSDVTQIQNYNKDVDRTFKAMFLEDLWDVRDNVRLTVGARYDDYSDFGNSFNPRAGLVWEFIQGYDLKLLYGRAFRAPSFYELYNTNNPAFVGNPDLNPETVDTYEISVGAELTEAFTARLTGFHNNIHDSIELATHETQDVFENQNEIRTQGVEAELKYNFGKGTYIGLNYTYQDAKNVDADEPLYNIPAQKGNIMGNVRASKYLNFYADFYFQEGFRRQKGDARDDENPGFGVLNATVIAKKFIPQLEGFEVRGTVYNILDADYTVPTSKDGLPVDYPMPGRSFLVDIRYTF